MNTQKNRKLLFIFSLISLALGVVVCVPFGLASISTIEIVVKYVVIPVVILAFTLINLINKYHDYKNKDKFLSVTTYTPIFTYVLSLMVNIVLVLIRKNVYQAGVHFALLCTFSLLFVGGLFLTHKFYGLSATIRKKDSVLIDVIFTLVSVLVLVCGLIVSFNYQAEGELAANNVLLITPLIISIIVMGVHSYILYVMYKGDNVFEVVPNNELYESWKKYRDYTNEVYDAAREDILTSFMDFCAQELGYEAVSDEAEVKKEVVTKVKTKKVVVTKVLPDPNTDKYIKRIEELQKELDDALNVIGASREVIIDTLQKCSENDTNLITNSLKQSIEVIKNERIANREVHDKQMAEQALLKAELQGKIDEYNERVEREEREKAEALKQAELDAIRKEQEAKEKAIERAKAKEAINPSLNGFIEAIKAIGSDREDMEVSANDTETLYRLTSHGKFVLSLQDAPTDYRVSVLVTSEELKELLYEYRTSDVVEYDRKTVNFATSKYELNVIKVIYKGNGQIEFDKVNELMNKSLANLLEAENIEQAAKDAIQAQKDRAKEAEKALREKERAEAKALRELEKQQEAESHKEEAEPEVLAEPTEEAA